MSNNVLAVRSASALAVINGPIGPLAPAFVVAERCRRDFDQLPFIEHAARLVNRAISIRNRLLPDVVRTHEAHAAFYQILIGGTTIDAPTALKMLGVLFGTLGRKKVDESTVTLLASCCDMFDPSSDAIGRSSGLWTPIPKHPAVLALAVKRLIATQVFSPAPCELRQACELVHHRIGAAVNSIDQWITALITADGVLFEFAREEWAKAYASNDTGATDVMFSFADEESKRDALAEILAKIEPGTEAKIIAPP